MPATAKYVGRPTRWGNPFGWRDYVSFRITQRQAKQRAMDSYRRWLNGEVQLWLGRRDWILGHLKELRGYDLACWCKNSDPCHADVLVELLNEAKQ